MTDYDDAEASIDEGAPVECYEFIGSFRSYYYTTDKAIHVRDTKTYVPLAGLTRSGIKAGTHEEDNTDLTIKLPISAQLVKDYAFQTTPPSLELRLWRFHRNTLTTVSYHRGPVASIVTENNISTLRVPTKFGMILQGNIPNVFIQPPCNNVLFDERCKVSRTGNSVDTTVENVNGRDITIASVGGFPDGWFIGGEIVNPARNERRMIVAQAGDVVTVNYQFSQLPEGTPVQVTAGCDHSYNGDNGCPKFANKPNFGGFPYVPGESKNPFTKGIE